MKREFKPHNQKILLVWALIIGIIFSCSPGHYRKSMKMTDEEYYFELRKDTSICTLPKLQIDKSLTLFLDTILLSKQYYKRCNTELHPYVYSIEERELNHKLSYVVETLFSTNNLNHFFDGAFEYKGEIFVVSSQSETKSVFQSGEKNQSIHIYFCDRIYHPKYKYITKIQDQEICIECIKNDIIKIK